MSKMLEDTGSIGLLDEKLSLITRPEPCRFAWTVGPVLNACQILSQHELTPAGGAFLVAIYDIEGRLMFALPIARRPIGNVHALVVGPEPAGISPALASELAGRDAEPGVPPRLHDACPLE